MSTLPTLFVSHGSPMLALDTGEIGHAWRTLAASLPRPRAILAVSAHWNTPAPVLSTAAQPATIHDFYGFPAPLYQLQYPAPGAPALAREIVDLLAGAGIEATTDPDYGLDHGAWTPLRELYPQADIPVLQLSVQPRRDPAWHYRVGQALSALPADGVLVLASGSLTHNLRDAMSGLPAQPYVEAFADWMYRTLTAGEVDSTLDYRHQAPGATRAHPTDEHLLPLFVALGAAGAGARATRFYHGEDSALSMDSYRFDPVLSTTA